GDSIGFLAALAPKTPPPPPPPGAPPGPGSKFEITDAELGDFTADFDFPGVWGLELRDMHGTASLIQSTLDPRHPIFGFDGRQVVAEGGGWLRVLDNDLPFDRVVINRIATSQDHPDDIQLDLAEADTGKSQLSGKGSFTGIYGLAGPDDKPGIDLRVAFAKAGDTLALEAHLDVNRLALDAGLALTGFHTESYLPRALRPLAGGRLDGKVDAHADLGKKAARIKKIDLRFARSGPRGLPREVRVRGGAELTGGQVKTEGLTVSVAGADATARGTFDLDHQLVDLALGVVASDLARLCGELGLPPLAKDARLDLRASGRLDDPGATGQATVHDLGAGGRKMRELSAKFGLEHGLARLERLSGPAFGGEIDAHGSLRLWEKSAHRPLKSPIVDLKLSARDIDLATLAPEAGVGGRLTVSADAHGPLDAVKARVAIPAGTPIEALGDKLSLGPVALETDGKSLFVEGFRVARRGGGAVEAHGRIGLAHQDLDLDVDLTKIPIAAIPGAADAGVPMSGFVSAKLHLGGRPDRPELRGDVDLADIVVRGVQLGKGHLALAPAVVGPQRAPGVAIHGQLFDRFDVDVDAALLPKGPSVHGRVAFRRLELHTLAPELVALGDGRSVASGRVAIDLDPGQPLALDVLLPELWLSIARAVDGPNGETTMQRVRIEAARPVHVHVAGDHIALDEAHFSTDGGDLRVEGRLDGRALSGTLAGHLDLELLQPF